jgi:hypothetical protein
MDRLMEANNVANLMRRRELPKPIVPQQMESSASLERRSFSDGQSMPVRPGVVIKEARIGTSKGKGPRLGQSRRAQVALVRFHVLGTGESRRSLDIAIRRSIALFLLHRSRRGGMRSADRPPAPSRKIDVAARRGELLRVSGNAGFRLRRAEVRHVKPYLINVPIRPGVRTFQGPALKRTGEVRSTNEQWSALRTRLYVARPAFSSYQPWSGVRPELQDVPGSMSAVGAVQPGSVAARVAQVRIELQESMRYAISSEEDKA